MGAGAIGIQVQILLLDLVFHVAARTVKVFITLLGTKAIRALLLLVLKAFGRQVSHDKTRIVFVLWHLGFSDDPPRACPTLKGLVLELCEAARHAATENGRLTDSSKLLSYQFEQPAVARQTQTIIDLRFLSFAPGHNLLATEATVGAHNDARFGTTFSHCRNDFLQCLNCTTGGVAIAGTKLGPERYRTDKGKQGQVTVGAVETVKETSFLMTVQRVVGSIQVDDNLPASLGRAAHTHQQKGILD